MYQHHDKQVLKHFDQFIFSKTSYLLQLQPFNKMYLCTAISIPIYTKENKMCLNYVAYLRHVN